MSISICAFMLSTVASRRFSQLPWAIMFADDAQSLTSMPL